MLAEKPRIVSPFRSRCIPVLLIDPRSMCLDGGLKRGRNGFDPLQLVFGMDPPPRWIFPSGNRYIIHGHSEILGILAHHCVQQYMWNRKMRHTTLSHVTTTSGLTQCDKDTASAFVRGDSVLWGTPLIWCSSCSGLKTVDARLRTQSVDARTFALDIFEHAPVALEADVDIFFVGSEIWS